MSESNLLVNQIKTPDGTILTSRHRHDYKTYKDKNGLTYMVDGGNDYIRRTIHKQFPYEERNVLISSPHSVKRERFEWGTYGKSGNEPLKYVILKDLSDGHIKAILETQPLIPHMRRMFNDELIWREEYSK